MKEIQQQQQEQYKFEEFEEYINLYTIVPAGKGDSLTLLQFLADQIQGGHFSKNPSIIIAGEGASTLAIAMANSIFSQDVRHYDANCIQGTRELIHFYGESKLDSVHIISNIEKLGNENILWNFLTHRVYRFCANYDGQLSEYIYLNGVIILTAKDITKVREYIIDAANFKVVLEPYSQEQLEMIIRQRLKFSGIYEQNKEVIMTIFEYSYGSLKRIIEILRICVMLVSQEGKDCLTLELLQKAVNMAYLPPDL